MGRKAQKNDSLPGSLDMLILRTLSLRSLHGYGIVQFIQQSSDNELLVEEGSLYPALQRLELNGWIEGVWGVTVTTFRVMYSPTRTCFLPLARASNTSRRERMPTRFCFASRTGTWRTDPSFIAVSAAAMESVSRTVTSAVDIKLWTLLVAAMARSGSR